MSVPSDLPTLPPLAVVFRFASVTENRIGKLVRLDPPDTLAWLTVMAFRFVHDVLYQLGPPPPPDVIVKFTVVTVSAETTIPFCVTLGNPVADAVAEYPPPEAAHGHPIPISE